jgi:hypothetical protein
VQSISNRNMEFERRSRVLFWRKKKFWKMLMQSKVMYGEVTWWSMLNFVSKIDGFQQKWWKVAATTLMITRPSQFWMQTIHCAFNHQYSFQMDGFKDKSQPPPSSVARGEARVFARSDFLCASIFWIDYPIKSSSPIAHLRNLTQP